MTTDPALVVTVRAASGGLGASTLAAGLATSWAASGLACVLVEAPDRTGLQEVAAVEDRLGLRWEELAHAEGSLEGARLVGALPRAVRPGPVRAVPHRSDGAATHGAATHGTGLPVLASSGWGGRTGGPAGGLVPAATVAATLTALVGASDVVVVDGDLASATELCHARGAVHVDLLLAGLEPAQACAAVRARCDERTSLVVRAPARDRALAAELAAATGLPLLARWGHDRAVRSAASRGLPPGGGRFPWLAATVLRAARTEDVAA